MRIRASLKTRLILYSLSLTFLVLSSLLVVSFLTLRDFLKASLAETTSYKLRVAMDYIDRDMERLVQLVNWSTLSDDVAAFVSSASLPAGARRAKALAAYYALRDGIYSNGLDGYVDKLLVGRADGGSVQLGLVQGDYRDFEAARREHSKSSTGAWRGLVAEPFAFSAGRAMIPLARSLVGDDDPGKAVGFAFMAVNTEVITRFLVGYGLEPGSRLFIGIGDSSYEIQDGKVVLDAALSGANGGKAGPGRDAVSYKGKNTGWTLSQTLPVVQLTRQNQVFAWLLALMAGLVLLLVFLLLVMVERTLNQPIDRINRRVALVAKGDFAHDPAIERDDELGNIGRAVNRLSRDLELLIARRVEDEKAKRSLELHVLQSQINPHFLYNTLSAIKWMAEIQKASGIAEMVNALASLLRHAARDSGELVTLERELELVGEYCTIQRYRSAKLFEIETSIGDDSLLGCEVLPFMLQPIVENAIMHGIEPKMAPGRIRIVAARAGERSMRIDVVDDGVGIEPERLAGLLREGPQDREAFNSIGLYNVHERLRLAFGEGSGLSIESRVGEYTKVSILLPCLAEAGRALPGSVPCIAS